MKHHDLSAEFATLDYDILFQVVTTAVALSRDRVYQEYNQINSTLYDNHSTKESLTGAVMASERLIGAANDLNEALETYHVMLELAKNRNTLVIKKLNKEVISIANE